MTWTAFDKALPDAASTGTVDVADTRNNQNSLYFWLILTTGCIPGFAATNNANGTTIPYDQPTEWYFRRGAAATAGSIWIKVALVWGTSGGANGNVTQADFFLSEDGGTTYQKMTNHANNRATLTYLSSGDLDPSNSVSWSLSP